MIYRTRLTIGEHQAMTFDVEAESEADAEALTIDYVKRELYVDTIEYTADENMPADVYIDQEDQ